MEWHERRTHFEKSAPCIYVGDIIHLQIADIEELGKFGAVGGGLVEHDDKLRVCQHCPRRVALEHIVHILRNARAERAVFADALPKGEEEVCAVFVHEQQINLVNEDIGVASLGTVGGNAVEDVVQHHQHTD